MFPIVWATLIKKFKKKVKKSYDDKIVGKYKVWFFNTY